MASKITEGAEIQESEEEGVERWRLGCFLDLGFPPSMADALATAKVDWHEAENILRKQPPGGFTWAFDYLMP